ncbi:MAG TPA: TlpA disulfide reductase family protein [Bacteroidia bacterium]|nr:TlpA disulfide reductase family protein [Bacteroidia bacterium]
MTFRNFFLLPALVLSLFACHNNTKPVSSTFELAGTLSGGGEGIKIYLDRLLPDTTMHLDSTVLDKSGNFSFHTPGIYKGFYNLRLTAGDFATLILDSTEKVHIEGNSQFLGNTYTVDGSQDSKLFWELNQQSKINYAKKDSIQKNFEALLNVYKGNQKKVDSISKGFEKPYNELIDQQTNYVKSFIKAHTSSFACLAGIQQIDPKTNFSYFISIDSALNKTYPTSAYVKLFHDRVTVMKRVAIGAPAPDFTMPDPDGKNISLSSFKGKMVLIDFWASWCKPCFETIPLLSKAYNKFKDKGFTILSVSLDQDKGHWVDAIKELNMDWPQVSDLKFKDSPILQLYNFRKTPYNVLVSKDGRILDKNIDEADLDHIVDSLLTRHI